MLFWLLSSTVYFLIIEMFWKDCFYLLMSKIWKLSYMWEFIWYFPAKYIYLLGNASMAVGKEGMYIFLALTPSSLKKIKVCPFLPTAVLTLVGTLHPLCELSFVTTAWTLERDLKSHVCLCRLAVGTRDTWHSGLISDQQPVSDRLLKLIRSPLRSSVLSVLLVTCELKISIMHE